MKEVLYSWIQDIAFYTLLMVLVLHVLPEREQRKYLQFFMGVILMILVLSPILQWCGLEQKLDETYAEQTYDQELREFRKRQKALEEDFQQIIEEKQKEAQEEQAEAEAEEGENIGISEIHIEIGAAKEAERD